MSSLTKQDAIVELIHLCHRISEDYGAVDLVIRDLCYSNPEHKIRFFIQEHTKMFDEREAQRAAQALADRAYADGVR